MKNYKAIFLALIIMITAISFIFLSSSSSLAQSALYNFQCSKCATVVQKSIMPQGASCSAGGAHYWHKLSEVGTNPYQCKKCGTVINAKTSPMSAACPSGGGHAWNKL